MNVMNMFEGLQINENSQSYLDLLSLDKWNAFTPTFGSLTVVGAMTCTGRYRVVGASVEFQVKFLAATSIASVAGADYLDLPIPAKGLSGLGTMTNSTTNVTVGLCHIDIATSRCFLPSQVASGDTFMLSGSYEGAHGVLYG